MSEPTVSVVLKRIRSLLDKESAISAAIKDQVLEVIKKIEELEMYLAYADEDILLVKTAAESEDDIDSYIYKVTSASRGSCSFLRRFLVQIAYKSEDAIDNIIYKVTSEGRGSCSLFKKYCTKTDHHQKQIIQDIIKKLDEAKEQIEALHLVGPTATAGHQQQMYWEARQRQSPPPSSPHNVVGFKKDINTLVEKLTRKDNHVRILYIVGPGGSGKTTLATELYQHPTIKYHFESAVWATVSQQRDAKGILLEILSQTQGTQEIPNGGNTEELVYKVCNILEQRAYFIILDDVKDADNLATYMFPMIQRSSHRSKIVITTHIFPSHPYKYEEYVVDPNEVVDSLAEKLTTKKAHETSIFHISGTQASTLLVNTLYEDPRVNQHFDSRKWIYIENDWNTDQILRKISNEIQMDGTENESLNDETPEQNLKNLFPKKPYLIVLDQVQEAENLAKHLHPILENTDHRSKVIFITNNPPSQLRKSEEMITGAELLETDRLVRRLTGEGDQPSLFSITDFDDLGGKTSLAKELYDHPTVERYFETKVWVPISKKWDATAALRHIIKEITGSYPSKESGASQNLPEKRDNEILADILLRVLEERKYLLVLDDMGDAEDLVFDLCAAQSRSRTHKGEAHKSKIIITVDNPRSYRHSNLSCYLYKVRPLTEDESWDLLCSIAVSHAANSSTMQQLISEFTRKPAEMLGKYEMLSKCNGVPLAVVALGGLLSTKETLEEWRSMCNALEKKETTIDGGLEYILSLSYYDLPSDITPCFLYLGLFPEHSVIPTGMLIRMWISEGIVTSDTIYSREDNLEDVATQYLEELASRCIIQVVRRNHIGEIKNIRLQDLIHRLSIAKAAELGFLERYPYKQIRHKLLHRGNIKYNEYLHQIREMLLRRAAIQPGNDKYPTKGSNLRSLIQLGKHGVSVKSYYFQHDAPTPSLEPIHEHFKLLRVLILCGIRTCKTLPGWIGNLTFLTYLGLRATNIQELPETIKKLRKLVTLDYRGSMDPSVYVRVPNVLSHMKALRHVYLPEYAMSSMKKLDLSTLDNLQTLWGVQAGDWIMEDLEKLTSSLIKLGIINISSKKELEVVSKWLRNGPKQLRVLKLDWHRAEHGRLPFPEHLQNFKHLHKLALIGRLKEEHNFMLLPSLIKLELFFSHLEIYDLTEKLGSLPQLKVLILWNSYKGTRWTCASNMFLKLEELQISHLPNLEEWRIEAGAMPQLKKISIFNCQKLRGLPKGLRCLNLQQLEILNMPRSFCSRLQETKSEINSGGEDLNIIENIRYIKFEAC